MLLNRLKGHTKPFIRSLNELFWGVIELCSLSNSINKNVRERLKCISIFCDIFVTKKGSNGKNEVVTLKLKIIPSPQSI